MDTTDTRVHSENMKLDEINGERESVPFPTDQPTIMADWTCDMCTSPKCVIVGASVFSHTVQIALKRWLLRFVRTCDSLGCSPEQNQVCEICMTDRPKPKAAAPKV